MDDVIDGDDPLMHYDYPAELLRYSSIWGSCSFVGSTKVEEPA